MSGNADRLAPAVRVFRYILVGTALCALQFSAASAQESEESEHLSAPIEVSDSGIYRGLNQLPVEVRSSKMFARSYNELYRIAGPSGVWDKDQYLKEVEKARRDLLASSGLAMKSSNGKRPLGNAWTSVGLQGTGPKVYSAGATSAIVVDPKDPNIMYAAGLGGGVWKSLDAGANWSPLTDYLFPNLAVSTVALDPVSTNNVFIGTGDCTAGYPSYGGSGVYRSKNGGADWEHVNVAASVSSVTKVLVHPSKNNIVFAASYDANTGLYRSTNGGDTWTRVYAAHGAGIVWDVIATGTDGATMYFIEGGNNSGAVSEGGIYKSVDDGATWTKLTSSQIPTAIGRSVLASPTKAPNKVFALVASPGGATAPGTLQGLYNTTDNGSTWSAITSTPSSLFAVNSSPAQGWYDIYLGVTPNSVAHDTIYIGGVEAYVSYGDADGWQIFSGYSDVVKESGPHVDHHSIAFNPQNPSIVYEGNDGGLYWSKSAGKPGTWEYRSHGMVTNRFYHLTLDRTNKDVTWAGAQDQGTWRLQNGQDPISYWGADGFQPMVNPQNPLTAYAEIYNGAVAKTTNYKSGTWSYIASDSILHDKSQWDAPLKMSPINRGTTPSGSILYLGRQFLWQWSAVTNSWKKLPPSFSGQNLTTAIGLAPWSTDVIYVSGNPSSFQLSTNFGTSFTAKKFPGAEVTSIQLTSADTNFVLVSMRGSNPVSVSRDRGATWTSVIGVAGSTLPNVNCESIAIDSTNPLTTWYAGTDLGMYYTTDAGQHWMIMGGGPGLMVCRDIQMHPNKTTIRVATFGRGIWEITPGLLGGNGDVEMNTLQAVKDHDGTHLSWATFGETNGATFHIERSINGNEFESIGSLDGLGASGNRHDYSFIDPTTAAGTYLFQIHSVDADGTEHYSNKVELHYGANGVIAYTAYPNPFIVNGDAASSATIRYELPDRDNVTIKIFNSLGKLVRSIHPNAMHEAGQIEEQWDGRDEEGSLVASGGYFYSIESAHYGTLVNKLSVVRQ